MKIGPSWKTQFCHSVHTKTTRDTLFRKLGLFQRYWLLARKFGAFSPTNWPNLTWLADSTYIYMSYIQQNINKTPKPVLKSDKHAPQALNPYPLLLSTFYYWLASTFIFICTFYRLPPLLFGNSWNLGIIAWGSNHISLWRVVMVWKWN